MAATLRLGDGKRASRGDVVSVTAYEAQAVILAVRGHQGLVTYGNAWHDEWVPDWEMTMVRRRPGVITEDGCQVRPGLVVDVAGHGFTVGVARQVRWGRVLVEFADGTRKWFHGLDLHASDDQEWTAP
jgi:hypothetical protein